MITRPTAYSGFVLCAAAALSFAVPAVAEPTSSAIATHAAAATPGTILTTPPGVYNASSAPGYHWKPQPAKYGVGVVHDLPIKAKDGVILRADEYYPTLHGKFAAGRFPVALIQSPYGKSTAGRGAGGGTGEDAYLVHHGFIDIVADVRGTGDSGGEFGLFDPIQSSDSKRIVQWAAKLPHSDGKLGLYGASYLGIDQVFTTGRFGKHDPVKAIFPLVTGNDLYRDTAFMGGLLDSEFGVVYLGLTSGLNLINPFANDAQNTSEFANLSTVEQQHLKDEYDFDTNFIAKTLTGAPTAYDEKYWKARTPNRVLANIVKSHIPAYLVGGEYDLFQRGEPLNYAALQNLWAGRRADAPMRPGQRVTGRYQLFDGPFTHLGGSAVNVDKLMLEWFDTWLLHQKTGMGQTRTPLHYYDLGTGAYHETSTYPFTGIHPQRYFLGKGSLSTKRSGSGTDQIVWSGTGNPCGVNVDQWATGPIKLAEQEGGFQNLPCEDDDQLSGLGPIASTYATAPFTAARTLGGPISASIYATSTTANTELVAEVEDVAPGGTATPLTEGALLGSLRAVNKAKSWTAPNGQYLLPYHPYTIASEHAVTPGKVTRYDIEIFPTLATIAKGHRIRLTLATADAPHLSATAPELSKLVGGVYRIQRTAAAPSSIELPLGHIPAVHYPAESGGAISTSGANGSPSRTSTANGSRLPDTGFSPALPLGGVALLLAAAGGSRIRRRLS